MQSLFGTPVVASDSFLNSLPVAIFRRSLDVQWTVQDGSMGFLRMLEDLGFGSGLTLPLDFAGFVLPQDVVFVPQEIRAQLAVGEDYRLEYRLCNGSGVCRWVQEQGKGIYVQGELLGVEGLFVLLAEDTRHSQHLLQERQMLQQLIMDAPVAIAMFDRKMHYLAYSYQWLIDFEIEAERDSLLGRSHYDLFNQLPEEWYELHNRAMAGEYICRPEEPFVLPSGRLMHFRRSLQPWFSAPGEIGGIMIVNQVLNSLVEAREEAIALTHIKSRFLATMSHELRTPLSGITSVAELLTKTNLSPRQGSLTTTLMKSAQHLGLIINDILDFSKLEAAALQLEMRNFPFYEEIDFLIELLGEDAHQKGLAFYVFADPSIPRIVQGDPLRLRQILTNLINNAIKFTDQGEIILRITLVEDLGQQLLLKFSVVDTGVGIPPEVASKLFKAFTQADVDTSRRYGGTGLGLAISKQLVELMGGHISIDSVPGEGSTFWFTIPVSVSSTAEGQQMLPPGMEMGNLAMVVVGENVMTRRLLSFYGGHCQMVCDVAATLGEAIALLQEQTYQLMFVAWADVKGMLPQLEALQERFEKTQVVMILHPLDHQRLIKTFPNAQWQYLFEPIRTNHLFDCFREISLERDEPPPRTTPPESLPIALLPSIDLKILLADDTEINREVVVSQLEYLGYHQVVCVSNGQEVLEAIATQTYDLIFLDCMMPKIDGYQTAAMIRQQFSRSATEPVVIAMTANGSPEDQEKCIQAGMNDHLLKPVTLNTLQNTLKHWGQIIQIASQSPAAPALVSVSELQPTQALIDLERLSHIIPNDLAWTTEFLQDYREASTQYLQNMQASLEQKDAGKLEYYAHQLKGISRMAAVNVVPQLAERIEQLAIANDIAAIAPVIQELTSQLIQVHHQIDREFPNGEQP